MYRAVAFALAIRSHFKYMLNFLTWVLNDPSEQTVYAEWALQSLCLPPLLLLACLSCLAVLITLTKCVSVTLSAYRSAALASSPALRVVLCENKGQTLGKLEPQI